jgi:hypothetical protein
MRKNSRCGDPSRASFVGEGVRQSHVPAIAPKLSVAARVGGVVQDDEVANSLEFLHRQTVVFCRQFRRHGRVRPQVNQLVDAHLDEGDAGGLQRFEEPARADGDTVADPKALHVTCAKTHPVWLGQLVPI